MPRKRTQKVSYPGTGERLRLAREALGMAGHGNQGKFAKVLPVTPHAYGQWENGVNLLPLEHAIRLHKAYGLSLDYIYLGRRDTLPGHIRDKLAPTTFDE